MTRIARLRYRLATRLLGYRPIPIPDDNGVYIVTRQDAYTFTVTASSLKLQMESKLAPLSADEWDMDTWAEYVQRPARTGTFSGTIG